MANVTPGQRQFEEQQVTLRKLKAAGLPATSRESNRSRPNNTSASRADSQGLAGSLQRRAVPDASFNQATYEAFESYDPSDRLASVEQGKREGKVSVDKQAPDAIEPPWF